MRRTLQVINRLKTEGIIEDYAIGGGIGTMYYTEPILTYDLDIFIVLKEKRKDLILLTPVFDYLKVKGYQWKGEHIIIEGFPTQFIPADPLEEEAVREARYVTYQRTRTKVMTPEYLVSILVRAGRSKDIMKVRMLLEEAEIDRMNLHSILRRYSLLNRFNQLKKRGLL